MRFVFVDYPLRTCGVHHDTFNTKLVMKRFYQRPGTVGRTRSIWYYLHATIVSFKVHSPNKHRSIYAWSSYYHFFCTRLDMFLYFKYKYGFKIKTTLLKDCKMVNFNITITIALSALTIFPDASITYTVSVSNHLIFSGHFSWNTFTNLSVRRTKIQNVSCDPP